MYGTQFIGANPTWALDAPQDHRLIFDVVEDLTGDRFLQLLVGDATRKLDLRPTDDHALMYDNPSASWKSKDVVATLPAIFKTDGSRDITGQLVSTHTGSAPLVVADDTMVTDLNANFLGGNAASAFATAAHTHTFLNLTDAPASYSGEALQVVRVNAGEDGLEFAPASAAAFTDMTDTPANYGGAASKVLMVNAGATDVEFLGPWLDQDVRAAATPTFGGLAVDGDVAFTSCSTFHISDAPGNCALVLDGTLSVGSTCNIVGLFTANSQIVSTFSGAPISVANTVVCPNLDSDLLDDEHGAFYLDSDNFTGAEWDDLTDGDDTILHTHKFNNLDNPDDDKTFIMTTRQIAFRWTNPSGHGLILEMSGAYSDEVLHIHQHTGNPSGPTHLMLLQSEDSDVGHILSELPASTIASYHTMVTGDTDHRFELAASGAMEWGSGAAARDTNLYRSAANVLKTDNNLEVEGILFTDDIQESTTDAGVIIEGVLIKDGLTDGIDLAANGVTAAGGLTDNAVLRGAGGLTAIQDSGWLLDDSDDMLVPGDGKLQLDNVNQYLHASSATFVTLNAVTGIIFGIGGSGEATLSANALSFANGVTPTSLNWGTSGQLSVGVDGTPQVTFADGVFFPVTDNDIDFGKDATNRLKNGFFAGALSAAEIANTSGDLKIMPDVQGDVILFGDTDVDDAADGKELRIWRRAAEGDDYLRFYVNAAQQAMIHSDANLAIQVATGKWIRISSKNDIFLGLGDNAGVDKLRVRDSDSNDVATIDSDGLITGVQFQSTIATGSGPPLIVASTVMVDNLNAQLLGGLSNNALVLRNGNATLLADWDAGGFEIRAETFQSDIATGSGPPFIVASEANVANLNASTVVGKAPGTSGNVLALLDGVNTWSAAQRMGTTNKFEFLDATNYIQSTFSNLLTVSAGAALTLAIGGTDEAFLTATGLSVVNQVRGEVLRADGDSGGVPGTTTFTNATKANDSTGAILSNLPTGFSANSAIWEVKYIGTTQYLSPLWKV